MKERTEQKKFYLAVNGEKIYFPTKSEIYLKKGNEWFIFDSLKGGVKQRILGRGIYYGIRKIGREEEKQLKWANE